MHAEQCFGRTILSRKPALAKAGRAVLHKQPRRRRDSATCKRRAGPDGTARSRIVAFARILLALPLSKRFSIGISDDAYCIESDRLRLNRGHHHPCFTLTRRNGVRLRSAISPLTHFSNKSPEPSPAAFRSVSFKKVRPTPGANE